MMRTVARPSSLAARDAKGIIGPGEGAKPREVYGVIPPDEKAEYGIEEESQHT